MIEYVGNTGGRYTYIEDLLNLQSLSLAFSSIFSNCDNFVISGCTVSGSTITEGYVYINGKIRHFNGTTNTTFPAYIYEANTSQTITYADAVQKEGRKIYSSAIATSIPTAIDPITNAVPLYITVLADGSTTRLNDAFFGKYALMVDSPRSTQTVNKPVKFSDKVTAVGFESTKPIILSEGTTATLSISYDSSGILTIQSQVINQKPYKFTITKDGEFKFAIDTEVIATVNSKGIDLGSKALMANSVQADSIKIIDSSLNNTTSGEDTGTVSINKVGYQDGTSKFRNLNIYDGKGYLLMQVSGSEGKIRMNGIMEVMTENPSAFTIKSKTTLSNNLAYQKYIQWLDAKNGLMSQIGYVSDQNNALYIINKAGNIEVETVSYFNVKGRIMENGINISDTYETKTNVTTLLEKKADVLKVYSKSDADNNFVPKYGAINSITTEMSKRGDSQPLATLRIQLGVQSTEDNDNRYFQKNNALSEISNNVSRQKIACQNIGALYKDDAQAKWVDSGWVDQAVAGGTDGHIYFRQIGNIVYIQGVITLGGSASSKIQYNLPNSITSPNKADIVQRILCDNNNQIPAKVMISQGKITIQRYTFGRQDIPTSYPDGQAFQFVITYMV